MRAWEIKQEYDKQYKKMGFTEPPYKTEQRKQKQKEKEYLKKMESEYPNITVTINGKIPSYSIDQFNKFLTNTLSDTCIPIGYINYNFNSETNTHEFLLNSKADEFDWETEYYMNLHPGDRPVPFPYPNDYDVNGGNSYCINDPLKRMPQHLKDDIADMFRQIFELATLGSNPFDYLYHAITNNFKGNMYMIFSILEKLGVTQKDIDKYNRTKGNDYGPSGEDG